MKQLLYILLFGLGLAATGCVEQVADFAPFLPEKDYSMEIAHDVEVIYSDSAKVKVKITGPISNRYIYKFKIEEEFPDGVHVEFYGPNGEVTSTLDARYALRKPSDREVIVRDQVVLRNNDGDTLQTNELIWDERNGEIYTERFVKITRPDELIYSRGFKTNERFDRYELQAVEGDLIVKELFGDESAQPDPTPRKPTLKRDSNQ